MVQAKGKQELTFVLCWVRWRSLSLRESPAAILAVMYFLFSASTFSSYETHISLQASSFSSQHARHSSSLTALVILR